MYRVEEEEVWLQPIRDLGAVRMWVVGTTPLPLYSPSPLPEGPGTYCTGGRLGLGADLDGQGKIAPPTGIRSPYRAARSEVLYLLRYPCRLLFENTTFCTQIFRVSVGRSEKHDVRLVLLIILKLTFRRLMSTIVVVPHC